MRSSHYFADRFDDDFDEFHNSDNFLSSEDKIGLENGADKTSVSFNNRVIELDHSDTNENAINLSNCSADDELSEFQRIENQLTHDTNASLSNVDNVLGLTHQKQQSSLVQKMFHSQQIDVNPNATRSQEKAAIHQEEIPSALVDTVQTRGESSDDVGQEALSNFLTTSKLPTSSHPVVEQTRGNDMMSSTRDKSINVTESDTHLGLGISATPERKARRSSPVGLSKHTRANELEQETTHEISNEFYLQHDEPSPLPKQSKPSVPKTSRLVQNMFLPPKPLSRKTIQPEGSKAHGLLKANIEGSCSSECTDDKTIRRKVAALETEVLKYQRASAELEEQKRQVRESTKKFRALEKDIQSQQQTFAQAQLDKR